MENTITASGLLKRFGQTRALDGLDLEVRAGEVHGFLASRRPWRSCSFATTRTSWPGTASTPWCRHERARRHRFAGAPGPAPRPDHAHGVATDLRGRGRGFSVRDGRDLRHCG